MIERPLLRIPVAVDDNAIVCLVDEVRAAADVIQVRGLALPALQLPRMRHKPDMHIVVLSKALDLGEHLTDVLCLVHVHWPLVVQFIVGVNHQAPDAISARNLCNLSDCACCGRH